MENHKIFASNLKYHFTAISINFEYIINPLEPSSDNGVWGILLPDVGSVGLTNFLKYFLFSLFLFLSL